MIHVSLRPHSTRPPVGVIGIDVYGGVEAGRAVLSFVSAGAVPRIPSPANPLRTDGLWKTTCFELFIEPENGTAYFEFNFSPSTQWAAYCFDSYREGMRDLPVASAPHIEPIDDGIRITIDLTTLPSPPWRIGLSAVIEEMDGTKSYWALAHAPGPPDFHNPDCFTARLPAPSAT